MKVAVLIDTWFPFVGGGQINAWEISKRLARKGNQIEIITRNLGLDNLPDVKNLNIVKIGNKSNASSQFSKFIFVFKSLHYLLKNDFDIIHAHAFLPGITLFLHARIKNTPTIFTVHGTSIGSNLNGALSTFIEKIILTKLKYTAQISVSRDFLKMKNVNKNIVYIPNGVSIQKFKNTKVKKNKQPTLLFVGRLHPQKNLINLIKAFCTARKKISNLQLIVVGEGEQKNELAKLVKSLKLQKIVTFDGKKTGTELSKIYKRAHVFILPSLYEGQSISLLEAMSNRLPPIVTNVGDNNYLVKDNYNGYIIKHPFTKQNISDCIVRAFDNQSLTSLGLRSSKTASEFNWENATKKTFFIYKSILL